MMWCKYMILVFNFLLFGDTYAQSKVSVSINNFKNSKGVCHVCLFDNPAAFKGTSGKAVECKRVKVENQKVQLSFESVRPGTYAIMTFHDANNNNEMDTNFLGIPSEGYGASKNNLPFAAAPTFSANKFVVSQNSTINLSIRLRNL